MLSNEQNIFDSLMVKKIQKENVSIVTADALTLNLGTDTSADTVLNKLGSQIYSGLAIEMFFIQFYNNLTFITSDKRSIFVGIWFCKEFMHLVRNSCISNISIYTC